MGQWIQSQSELVTKRLFDLFAALLILTALSPLLGVVALFVRCRHGSPVLFSQVRPGLHGRPFRLYKFRTMTNQCDSRGELLADNLRLTSLGSFLRKTSIDELPELLNVIKGEMSLVGPRPLLMEYLPYYSRNEMHRHDVKPGITGWAQINGRNFIPWDERLSLDVWYVNHRSLLLDIRILFLTVWKVLCHDGVAVDPDSAETNLREERCGESWINRGHTLSTNTGIYYKE